MLRRLNTPVNFSRPEFFGGSVYKLRQIVGKTDFSEHFKKIVTRYKKKGHIMDILRQTACMVVNSGMVDNTASCFNCMPLSRPSD